MKPYSFGSTYTEIVRLSNDLNQHKGAGGVAMIWLYPSNYLRFSYADAGSSHRAYNTKSGLMSLHNWYYIVMVLDWHNGYFAFYVYDSQETQIEKKIYAS